MSPTVEDVNPSGVTLAGRVAFIRRRTEAVYGAALDAMLGALEDLGTTASALVALAETLSPDTLARLRGLQPRFDSLGAQVRAKADRCQATAGALDRHMSEGRHRLEELRGLARTATLVSLNALVVSRSLHSDGGTIDGLARSMRSVLGEVAGLVSDLGLRIAAGQTELRQVEQGAAALAEVAGAEALPALREFAELIQARSRDGRVARSARLVSKRFEALENRVGQVILHLQVGDAFRQRLEHVEAILDMAEGCGPGAAAGALEILAAAQLRAALEDLGGSSHVAVRHLSALARTAADIPRAGAIESLRSSGRDGLGALVSASGRIEAVIGRLTDTTHRLTGSSRDLAETLADAGQDAGEAAEFERRMTVLGLNAILLASRLGPEGRAMEEVAQQQRNIARSIIDVMSRLRGDLEGVVSAAGDLHDTDDAELNVALQGAEGATVEVKALSDRVRRHLAALEGVRSAGDLVKLVEEARKEIECFAEMAASLDRVARDLEARADRGAVDEGGAELLSRARSLYSMQAERLVHDRLFPRPDTAEAQCADAALEDDVLFA